MNDSNFEANMKSFHCDIYCFSIPRRRVIRAARHFSCLRHADLESQRNPHEWCHVELNRCIEKIYAHTPYYSDGPQPVESYHFAEAMRFDGDVMLNKVR